VLARTLRTQLGLARALWWGVRGRTDVGPDDLPLPYNGLDRALVWTLVVLGVLETVVVHLLVSWPPLRWSLSALGVYGVLGLLAVDLTMRQHPHVVRDGELLLRCGHFRSVRVPLDRLASVRRNVQNGHEKTLEVGEGGLALTFMGGTNVELRFAPSVEALADRRSHRVDRVSFSAHDPATAVAILRPRILSTEP
jgi:hypothetical protein